MKTSILLALCASVVATDPSNSAPPPPIAPQGPTASVESDATGAPHSSSPDHPSTANGSPGHTASEPTAPTTVPPPGEPGTAPEARTAESGEPTPGGPEPSAFPEENPLPIDAPSDPPPSTDEQSAPVAPEAAPAPSPPKPTASAPASHASRGDRTTSRANSPVGEPSPSPSVALPPSASGAEAFSLSELAAGEDWLENLLLSATSTPTVPSGVPPGAGFAHTPPPDADTTGDRPRLPRLFWLFVAILATNLASRVARRTTPGRVRRLLDRLVALGRAATLIAGLSLLFALLPTQWRPWALVLGASAAAALGWSLRPRLADLVAGIYLGLQGRLSPGAPVQLSDAMGLLHQPGPWSSVVRVESGALRTVPNRLLQVVARRSWQSGRRSLTVTVPIPGDTDPNDALAAVRWVCDLLPWTADDPPSIQLRAPGQTASWTVQLIVLGDAPPSDRVRVLFPRLVCDVLQRGKVSQAPPPSAG